MCVLSFLCYGQVRLALPVRVFAARVWVAAVDRPMHVKWRVRAGACGKVVRACVCKMAGVQVMRVHTKSLAR